MSNKLWKLVAISMVVVLLAPSFVLAMPVNGADWNHPTDQPDDPTDCRPIGNDGTDWNHPTDQPDDPSDSKPVGTDGIDWNHPTDQPDDP